MPRYEIYYEERVSYDGTYEAESREEAWNKFWADHVAGHLLPTDSDLHYYDVWEAAEDA